MNPARSLGSAIFTDDTLFDDTFVDTLGDRIDGTVD
jgi:hypothetical protein